jgi:TATA-box binding protein (TBP) (component of TFIID and TFIIIB)
MEASRSGAEQEIKNELEAEIEKLFEHLERDEEGAAKLAKALEPESTSQALHFALFPCRTRDGGQRPTCREPVVSMMAFVVDLFSPHDGSVDLLALAENFRPTGDDGIVGVSYQYKNGAGNSVTISRGKVKDAKRQFAHQVQLRLCLPSNPNISVKVFKTGRLQIAGCKDEPTCKIIIQHVLEALNSIQQTPAGANVFERHVCEPSGQHVPIKGPLQYDLIVKPETVNINCTFDAGYSFVGYTLDPVALKEVVERPMYASCIKSVEYTPEKRYAGLKIIFRPPQPPSIPASAQLKREVFIGIFPSSKTVITGAVNWAEVDDAYDFASGLLLRNFEDIRRPLEDSRSRRSN